MTFARTLTIFKTKLSKARLFRRRPKSHKKHKQRTTTELAKEAEIGLTARINVMDNVVFLKILQHLFL